MQTTVRIMLVLLRIELLLLLALSITTIIHGIIITVPCRDGVLIGCDTVSPSNGAFVANRHARKIHRICPNIAICCAAGLSEFIPLLDDLKNEYRKLSLVSNSMMKSRHVATIARQLIKSKYNSVHLLLIGIEESANVLPLSTSAFEGKEDNSGHSQQQLFEITPGGTLIDQSKSSFCVLGDSQSNGVRALLSQILCRNKKLTESKSAKFRDSIDTTTKDQVDDDINIRYNNAEFPMGSIIRDVITVLVSSLDADSTDAKLLHGTNSPIELFLQKGHGLSRISIPSQSISSG